MRLRAEKARATRAANLAAKGNSSATTTAAASARKKVTPLPPRFRILSIDVGLRNLGLAVVQLTDDAGAEELLREMNDTAMNRIRAEQTGESPTSLSPTEESTTPATAAPAPAPLSLCSLLASRIYVEHAENVDVLEENGCRAKNAKAIGPLRQVTFWHGSMMRRAALFLDPPPDVVVVEVQDGGNATMRQMSTGIVGLFMGHFEARHRDGHIPKVPTFTMVRGDMKLKVSEAIQKAWGGGKGMGVAGNGTSPPLLAPITGPGSAPPSATPVLFQVDTAAVAARLGMSTQVAGRPGTSSGPPTTSPAPSPLPAPALKPVPPPPEYLRKINPRRYFAMARAHQQYLKDQQWIEANGGVGTLGGGEGGEGDCPSPCGLGQSGERHRPTGSASFQAAGSDEGDEAMETLNPAAKRRASTGRSKAAYEMRKKAAVAAFELYMDRVIAFAPHLLCRELRTGWKHYTQKKRRDVSDAVLQALYVLARDLKVDIE